MKDNEIITKLIEHLQGFIKIEEFLGNSEGGLMGKHIVSSKELINTIMLQKLNDARTENVCQS